MENYTTWNNNFSQVLSELDWTGSVEGGGGGGGRRGRGASALLGCALLLLIVSTLLGNALVCAAVVKFRHLRSKVTNLFVISLAVSDLCVAALVMPWEAATEVAGSWPFGRGFCGVWVAFDIMCSTASILNLCIISVDRYWAIASPFKYERKMTRRVAFVMIGVAWTLSILISFIPVHLNWHEAEAEAEEVAEAEEEEVEVEVGALEGRAAANAGGTGGNLTASCVANLNKTYAISSSLVSFYIPVVIMIATYTRIYRIAQTQIRRITSLERAAAGQAHGHGDSRLAHDTSLKTSFRRETKVLKTLSVIVGVFVCCWLPFFVLNCAMPFCDPPCVSDATFAVFVWFGWANSSLNPVIYAFNADFRRAFAAILGCGKIRSGNAVEAVNISNELVSYRHDTTLQKDAQDLLLGAQHHPHAISAPGEDDEGSPVSNNSGGRRRRKNLPLLPVQFECDGEISLDTITPFTSAGPLECDRTPGEIEE